MNVAAEHQTLLSDLFDSARLDGSRSSVVRVDPDRVAYTDSSVTFTWAEAIDWVGRVAGALVAAGIGPGDRVAVRMPKSAESFLAVHAVLRCGAVMVPLDPMAPVSHAVQIIADAEVEVVIADTRARHLAEIVDASEIRTVVLPHLAAGTAFVTQRAVEVVDAEGLGAVDSLERPVAVALGDPAYIIYTSGSTGRPKGIVHTQGSALAYARAAVEHYGLDAADRFANIAPLHFDQSTFELYAAPMVGATVLVVPDPVMRFPASLSDLISRERITVWYSVPFLLEQMSSRGALAERDLSSLRWILYGGEAYPPGQLAALMRQLPNVTVSNVYGPAEVNQCTVFDLASPPTGTVPIGAAWHASTVRVVDPDDISVDLNDEQGLLLVASATMMSHYWKRPDLTRASIVEVDGERWYNTGDMVERSPGGHLVFLGRRDNQVKVRGHRIELEVIDELASDVAGVEVAATVVSRVPDASDVIITMIVRDRGAEGEGPEGDDLALTIRKRLAARLPPYAVPADVLIVDDLPRTGTGKIDRLAAGRILDVLQGLHDPSSS